MAKQHPRAFLNDLKAFIGDADEWEGNIWDLANDLDMGMDTLELMLEELDARGAVNIHIHRLSISLTDFYEELGDTAPGAGAMRGFETPPRGERP